MGEAQQVLFARNLINICVDKKENGDYIGRIWHQYSDDAVSFNGVSDMMLLMDDLYDEWDFPQRGLDGRKFYKDSEKGSARGEREELTIDRIASTMGVRNIQKKRGEIGTFVVQVTFRQNATWQGHVLYMEENEKCDFESAKELIDYMDKKLSSES